MLNLAQRTTLKTFILAIIAGLLFTGAAHAADLIVPQMQALKAAALSDPTAAGYLTNGNDNELAQWFNAPNGKIVWRTVITPDLMREALVAGAAQLDGLTAGKRDSLFYLASGDLQNTAVMRTALDDLTGSQATLKAAVVAAEKRASSKAESILAPGTGTTASPATLTWEGWISIQDASAIRSQ